MKSTDDNLNAGGAEFLTVAEAGAFLRLAPQTMHNLMRRGAFKRGVHYWKRPGEIGPRFSRRALWAWLMEGTGEDEGSGIRMARGYFLGGKS